MSLHSDLPVDDEYWESESLQTQREQVQDDEGDGDDVAALLVVHAEERIVHLEWIPVEICNGKEVTRLCELKREYILDKLP